MVAFVFFRIVILVISFGQKHKINKTGFRFVGWCMMNIVSESHTQIRKIERGMANLHLLAVTWLAQLVVIKLVYQYKL